MAAPSIELKLRFDVGNLRYTTVEGAEKPPFSCDLM